MTEEKFLSDFCAFPLFLHASVASYLHGGKPLIVHYLSLWIWYFVAGIWYLDLVNCSVVFCGVCGGLLENVLVCFW